MVKPLPVRDMRGLRGYHTASSAEITFWRSRWRLLRAGGAVIDPLLHGRDKIRAIERRGGAAIAGIPAPADQFVVRNVFHYLRQRTIAVFGRVFELAAELAGRLASNNHLHFGRRQRPFRISRRHIRAGKIRVLVAGVALHAVQAFAVGSAFYILNMDVTVVALQRSITRRMTILAARRIKNGPGAKERRLGGGGF